MRWLARLEEGLIMALMAAMTLLSFTQVVARYVFNYSFVWALEVTGVMFAWLIFIGMAYGVRVGAHIGVDAAVRLLGDRAARAVGMVSLALCIAYSAIVFWGGTQYVLKMHQVGIEMEDVPIQQWIPRLVLPIGFGLLLLRFAQALWMLARGETPPVLHDEVHDAMQLAQGPDALDEGAPR
ncbi:MAG TPA: TRAP transporter small permease [Ramlibacter sp.]